MKINNKKFLEYIKENERSNTPSFIKSVRINKKSISVTTTDSQFLFNGLFREKNLYNMIIHHLASYTGESISFLKYVLPFRTFKVNRC